MNTFGSFAFFVDTNASEICAISRVLAVPRAAVLSEEWRMISSEDNKCFVMVALN